MKTEHTRRFKYVLIDRGENLDKEHLYIDKLWDERIEADQVRFDLLVGCSEEWQNRLCVVPYSIEEFNNKVKTKRKGPKRKSLSLAKE